MRCDSCTCVICVRLKIGLFQLFKTFYAILLTGRYNRCLKISKLSSRLSFQLRQSEQSGVAEKVLGWCPSPLALIQKQEAESTFICVFLLLCSGRLYWNSLLRILLWIQLLLVFYMQTSELSWNCSYFLLYGCSHFNCTLSWFSWLGVLKAFLCCICILGRSFHSAPK